MTLQEFLKGLKDQRKREREGERDAGVRGSSGGSSSQSGGAGSSSGCGEHQSQVERELGYFRARIVSMVVAALAEMDAVVDIPDGEAGIEMVVERMLSRVGPGQWWDAERYVDLVVSALLDGEDP